jgi:hypothetical protein
MLATGIILSSRRIAEKPASSVFEVLGRPIREDQSKSQSGSRLIHSTGQKSTLGLISRRRKSNEEEKYFLG